MNFYRSKLHLAITFLFIAVPFLFLFAFSSIVHIAFDTLLADFSLSLVRIGIAYVIAVILGWYLAVFFSQGKFASITLPVFDVLQSFPTFAALPMAVVFWGASNMVVITFLAFAIIWPILFSIVSSLRLVRSDWHEAVQMSRLSGFRYVRYFLLPTSMPGLITGSIIGMGDGWEALIATEIIVGVKGGLGGFFNSFSQNPPITMAAIFGFLLLIFSINKLLWLPLLEWSHHKMEE